MNFPPPTNKQARLIWLALTGLAMVALGVLITLLCWSFGKVIQILSPVLWPVAVAAILAFLLNPIVDFFQRKGRTRTHAILIVFGLMFLILTVAGAILVPRLVNQTRQLVDRLPVIVQDLRKGLNDLADKPLFRGFFRRPPGPATTVPATQSTNAEPGIVNITNITTTTTVTHIVAGTTNAVAGSMSSTNAPSFPIPIGELDAATLQNAKNWLTDLAHWVFGKLGTWLGALISLVLVPIYAFYFLVERQEIEKNWTEYLPVTDSRFKTELVFVLRAFKNYLAAFFRGQILVAFCEGILYTIGFLLIDLPYGLLLGASAAILTIVPFLGAVILCITAFTVAVVQCADWLHPALVLAVVVIVQSLEVFWISPWIMRGRVGLHPAIIIFAVMAGTMLLGGLLGGILAIPLAAMLKIMLSRYVWKRRVTELAP